MVVKNVLTNIITITDINIINAEMHMQSVAINKHLILMHQ